jgi:hypothetical protein
MGSVVLGFLRFWYDFIVGDDWTVAAGVIAALAVTSILARGGMSAWWLLPVVVGGLLFFSLQRAARSPQ